MSVLIDTSVLAASVMRNDGRHARASGLLRAVATELPFITDHVAVEAFNLIARNGRHHLARAFWLGLSETPIAMEVVTGTDVERARSIAERWPDQRFSLADCSSFAVMERLGCSKVASFDADFAIYRYGVGGKKAFEIVR